MKNNLVRKFLSFSIGGYINLFIGLLTVPITTRLLSPEQYGVSSLIITITNVLVIFCCLGLEQGFVRFFYEEKEDGRGKLLYNSLYYPFFISICIFLLIFLFRNKISLFILGKEEKYIWIVLILSVFFSSLKMFSFLVVRMKQRAKLYSFFNVLIKVLQFILILILYKVYGDNYKTLVLAVLFSLIIVTLFSIIFEKKIWSFKGNGKITRKELMKFSTPLALTMGLSWMFGSCDKIIIKVFSSLNELGLYSGAFKLISLITIVQSGFTTFWTPTIYEHYSKYPKDKLFFKKANDYLSMIFFIIGIGILMVRNLLVLLLGKEYSMSLYIMPMLVFIPIMYLISETTMLGIGFKKKSIYSLYISIIVSVSNLLGNLLLVPYLGARGAAISTGISYILFFIFRTYFSKKLIDFGFELKRIYIIISLMTVYALALTFYNNIYFTVIIGLILEGIILLVYFPVVKELYNKYLKKEF